MKPHHTILLAEDDHSIRNGLVDTLELEGYGVLAAANGVEALKLFRQGTCDLALLDVMMPGMSGYDLCREIRRRDRRLPVLFLTAKSEEIDKVVGLELGADDYITKPFGSRELMARIAAALRRAAVATEGQAESLLPPVFCLGTAEIDRRAYRLRAGGREHPLTPRELQLLEIFARRPGEALTRELLLDAVWGIDYLGTTRTLDQHVLQLRKKLESDPAHPQILQTVHGVGYRCMESPSAISSNG
jgi:DNA-binding response OmpR family regulator